MFNEPKPSGDMKGEAGPKTEETVVREPGRCSGESRAETFEAQSLGSCLGLKQTPRRTSTLLTIMKAVPGMIRLS